MAKYPPLSKTGVPVAMLDGGPITAERTAAVTGVAIRHFGPAVTGGGAAHVAMIGAEMPLEPVAPNYPGEVVERWRYSDGSGEIGVIASVTRPFCGGCTRARLSADGKLFTCLFAIKGHDLRALLRDGASDAQISAAIGAIWRVRDDRYSELRTAATAGLPKVEMSYIGG